MTEIEYSKLYNNVNAIIEEEEFFNVYDHSGVLIDSYRIVHDRGYKRLVIQESNFPDYLPVLIEWLANNGYGLIEVGW